MLIEINGIDASKEYSFKYKLPENYSLVYAEDWFNNYVRIDGDETLDPNDYYEKGEVCIITSDGTVVGSIDSPWAIDAKGESVPTHYEIKGSSLVQIIDFDENTSFPVVADPTEHPNKTKNYYLTKAQVLKTRDKYSGGTARKIFVYITSLAAMPAGCVVGAGWATIVLAGEAYNSSKYGTWDKIYVKFPSDKKYAKIAATWKWHGGHKEYYPTGKVKASYVKSK